MVEFPITVCKSQTFLTAWMKLINHTRFPVKTAMDVVKTYTQFQKERERVSDTYTTLVKKFAELDEKGEIVWETDNEPKVSEAKKEEYKAELKKFEESKIKLDCTKFNQNELDGVGLSPAELHLMEPLITTLEIPQTNLVGIN